MAKMMSTSGILTFILQACLVLITGCNKVDLEDRSKITITGNTLENIDLNKTYEVSGGEYEGPHGIECVGIIHETGLQFSLGQGAMLEIGLQHESYDEAIPEGTYSVVGTDCEEGVKAYLTSTGQKKALYRIDISSGTMKVKDDHGTFDINFDFTISSATGGGRLTGNFTGTLPQADMR